MKQFLLILSLVLITTAFTANTSLGEFHDTTNTNKTTISKALKMPHNSYVTLQGNIIKQISEDKYLFKDATGTITVEIDNDKWQNQNVNAKDKLELKGEIEKDLKGTKLDVDTVTIIK